MKLYKLKTNLKHVKIEQGKRSKSNFNTTKNVIPDTTNRMVDSTFKNKHGRSNKKNERKTKK